MTITRTTGNSDLQNELENWRCWWWKWLRWLCEMSESLSMHMDARWCTWDWTNGRNNVLEEHDWWIGGTFRSTYCWLRWRAFSWSKMTNSESYVYQIRRRWLRTPWRSKNFVEKWMENLKGVMRRTESLMYGVKGYLGASPKLQQNMATQMAKRNTRSALEYNRRHLATILPSPRAAFSRQWFWGILWVSKHWGRFQVDADSDNHLTLTSETMDVSDGD